MRKKIQTFFKVPFTSHSLSKGFTIVEMLLYMGILTILIGVLGSIFASILDTQLQSNATSNVDQDGRYIMAKLVHDMQTAQSITTPASPGQQTSSLQIVVNSVNYTYSLSTNSGALQLLNDKGTNNLNGVGTTVSNLTALRIGSGGTNDTVRINFTLTSTAKRNGSPEVRTFQSTLGLQ